MVLWEQCVELLRMSIFSVSQACGGNLGTGIVLVGFVLRIVLLPLTLKLARISAAHQESMHRLKPELDRLRTRFKKQPERLAQETQRVFEREDVSPFPVVGCLGNLVQLPMFLAMFSAVRRCAAAGGRFLWIGNIAKPDILLTLAVTALTGASVAWGAQSAEQGRTWLILIPTVVAFFALSKMAAGVGLYWGVSSAVSLLQSAILRRERLGSAQAS